jgi:pseudouridine synthase
MEVEPGAQRVSLDGRPVRPVASFQYLALHKPVGYLSSCGDPRGRKTVLDLIPKVDRLFPVGRLDLDSRGLLLLTNDGDLTQRLTHPRYGVSKEYRLRVRGHPTTHTLGAAARGVLDQGELLRCEGVKVLRRGADHTDLQVTLREGKRRELRRLWRALEHPVQDLCREAVGPVRLGRLKEGAYRELTAREIHALQQAGEQKP